MAHQKTAHRPDQEGKAFGGAMWAAGYVWVNKGPLRKMMIFPLWKKIFFVRHAPIYVYNMDNLRLDTPCQSFINQGKSSSQTIIFRFYGFSSGGCNLLP